MIKTLASIKGTLSGDNGEEPNQANCIALANDILGTNFFRAITRAIPHLPQDVFYFILLFHSLTHFHNWNFAFSSPK